MSSEQLDQNDGQKLQHPLHDKEERYQEETEEIRDFLGYIFYFFGIILAGMGLYIIFSGQPAGIWIILIGTGFFLLPNAPFFDKIQDYLLGSEND